MVRTTYSKFVIVLCFLFQFFFSCFRTISIFPVLSSSNLCIFLGFHLESQNLSRILIQRKIKLSCYILYLGMNLTQFVSILNEQMVRMTERTNEKASSQASKQKRLKAALESFTKINEPVWSFAATKNAYITKAGLLYKQRLHTLTQQFTNTQTLCVTHIYALRTYPKT